MSSLRSTVYIILLAGFLECSPQQTPAADSAKSGSVIQSTANLDLEVYRGKVVLVNFWATWCGPCRIEIPDLVRLNKQFDRNEVVIIGISLDKNGTSEELRIQLERFRKDYKIDYPIFLDNEGVLHRRFGSFAYVPATFLLDRQGHVAESYWGVKSFRVFAEGIERLLQKS